MEEREEGMTLGEIFSLMFKKKLLLLIITLAVALVGMLAIFLFYNRSKSTATLDFYYKETILNDSRYANGESFAINDVISEENIKEVIASNEKYNGLDAKSIHDNISIQAVTVVVDEKATSTSSTIKNYYELKLAAKYIKDKSTASSFFDDLLSHPINKNETIINEMNYKQNLERYNEAKTYAQQFDYLTSAISELEAKYNNLITTYGDVSYTDDKNVSRLLSDRLKDIQLKIEEMNLTVYKNSTADYGLVLNYTYSKPILQNSINNLNEQVKQVDKQLEANKAQYDQILKTITESGTTVLSLEAQSLITKRSELEAQKLNLEYQIEKINLQFENETATNVYYGADGVISESAYNKITDATVKAGYTSLNIKNYQTSVKNVLTETYNYVSDEIDTVKKLDLYYNDPARSVRYVNNEGVKYTGSLNTIIAILLPIILGLVIGCIVNFALGYGDFKKKKLAELEVKEQERIKKQIAFQKMLKENGLSEDNK